VRLLLTSDWHVGKRIRGHSRADEHRAVLAEIAGLAESESVDLVGTPVPVQTEESSCWVSACSGLLCPLELSPITPHAVKDHRQLSRNRCTCLLHA